MAELWSISPTTNTWTASAGTTWLFSVEAAENGYVVSERRTNTHGSGGTLGEAFADFVSAAEETLDLLEREKISPRLERERDELRRLLKPRATLSKKERSEK